MVVGTGLLRSLKSSFALLIHNFQLRTIYPVSPGDLKEKVSIETSDQRENKSYKLFIIVTMERKSTNVHEFTGNQLHLKLNKANFFFRVG